MTPPDDGVVYRPSVSLDDAAIKGLLERAGLPSSDLATGAQELLVACRGDDVVGAIGLEISGPVALMRSFVVEESLRGAGIGHALYDRSIAVARARGVETIYLLTTTAEAFFARAGFTRVDRRESPPAVARSSEFASLCPATAAFMMRPL